MLQSTRAQPACDLSSLLQQDLDVAVMKGTNERQQFNKKLYFNSPVINRVVKRFTRDYGAKIET